MIPGSGCGFSDGVHGELWVSLSMVLREKSASGSLATGLGERISRSGAEREEVQM